MPKNKAFKERLEILDSCLRRRQRNWSVEELLLEINKILIGQFKKPISKRTLQYDLDYLINEENAPIKKERKNGKVLYYYTDANYSIRNLPLDDEDLQILRDALSLIKPLSGFKMIDDVHDVIVKLERTIVTNVPSRQSLIQYEMNTKALGEAYLDDLFTAIKEKMTLKIQYQPFSKSEPYDWLVHPYLLKQYRNRWFLIARVGDNQRVTNLALDRIKKIANSKEPFLENDIFDPEIYYNNLIGVTTTENDKPEDIEIKVATASVPYILTKPIHFSQETLKTYKDGSIKIGLKLIHNFELRTLLFSYGPGIEVLKPVSLREKLKEELEKTVNLYR